MNRIVCLFALFACTQPAAVPKAVTSSTTCPDCPACPTRVCPTLDCRTCPTTDAPKPSTATTDWHCMDIIRSTGSVSGFCYTLAHTCEDTRAEVRRKQLGKPSACVAQRIAHCFETTRAWTMSRQLVCARTAENCEVRRKYLLERPPVANDATECRPTLNQDTYESRLNGSVQRPARP